MAAVVMLLPLAACSGASGRATTGATTAQPSAVTSSPSISEDPFEHPTIDGSYSVTAAGRQLRLVCWGTGSPTVLLETGGSNIEEWTDSGIVRRLASVTRACTYDRAGTGSSDPAPNEKRDADDAVADTHALLAAAQVQGPLVLLGRSFGGMLVTYYADVMPREVVGVIVYDTPAPSAEFTKDSEPELVWNAPGNTEHLDVVGGFENRFARHPAHVDAPLLLITPVPGEGSVDNESFWLHTSRDAEQKVLSCGEDEPTTGSPCATAVAEFVTRLRAQSAG